MSSLPFLVVLDVCTTLARFDLGIVVRGFLTVVGCVKRKFLEVTSTVCLFDFRKLF